MQETIKRVLDRPDFWFSVPAIFGLISTMIILLGLIIAIIIGNLYFAIHHARQFLDIFGLGAVSLILCIFVIAIEVGLGMLLKKVIMQLQDLAEQCHSNDEPKFIWPYGVGDLDDSDDDDDDDSDEEDEVASDNVTDQDQRLSFDIYRDVYSETNRISSSNSTE